MLDPGSAQPGCGLGFRSLETEVREPVELEVRGTIPRGLEGTLYRVGPARHDVYGDRYRPYYEGRYPDYTVRYFVSSPAEAKFYSGDRDAKETLKANVRAFSWTYNALGGVLAQRRYRKAFAAKGPAEPEKKSKDPRYADYGRYSGYYDYSKEDLNKLRFALSRIVTLAKAKGRKVYVFTIPIGLDFERHKKDGAPPLVGEMTRMAKEAGFGYADLLAPLKTAEPGIAPLFHACDDHWSPRGHAAAAQALAGSFY
jgi:hypothetical protein